MKFFVILAILIPWFASASVVINEIAWMGDAESSYCEWVELYNDASANIDLSGWGLYEVGSSGDVLIMTLTQPIAAAGYYLIERVTPSCPDPVSGIAADDAGSFGGSGLSNSGEILILKNVSGDKADRVEGSNGWRINGGADIVGNNTTKETMQRLSAGGWITAVATPRAANEIVTNQEPGITNYGIEIDAPGASIGGAPIQEQKLFFMVDAGKDITTVAGAEVRFQGATFNFDGKPLDETSGMIRYLWNFGDGSFFEGKNTNHIYRYPGAYRAALQVSSGQTSGSDAVEVIVGESSVAISEVAGAWIELVNEGAQAVDLSSWQIHNSAGQTYAMPAHTIIGPRAFVVFSQETTGLLFEPVNPKAELRYANGTLADSISFAGALLPDLPAQAGKSIIRDGEGNVTMGEETPGRENSIFRQETKNQKLNTKTTEQNAKISQINPNVKAQMSNLPDEQAGQAKNQNDQKVNSKPYTPNSQTASLTDSNYFWLAVSISIGLIAGVVVLALRAMVLF